MFNILHKEGRREVRRWGKGEEERKEREEGGGKLIHVFIIQLM